MIDFSRRPESLKESFRVDRLLVEVFPDRVALGRAAGQAAADILRDVLAKKESARVIFAAAPSQNECLDTLVGEPGIDWNRVTALHMDEYIGLPVDAPERFSHYLKTRIFDRLPFKEVFLLDDPTLRLDNEEILKRYRQILAQGPVDLVCMGIGENGHIAFNDPPAPFDDPEAVKIVDLDLVCRQQQVNDGCFPNVDAVPKQAVSLTIPTLTSAAALVCSVPGKFKRRAVRQTLTGPVSEDCTATALRQHPNATLFVDEDSCDVTE